MANRVGRTLLVLAVPTVIVGGVGAWQGIVHWWNKGYSQGTRTGTLRKVSTKGTPLCRYASIEMIQQGSVAIGAANEAFEFTLDDTGEENPLYRKLQVAERTGRPVTVEYREDRHQYFWRTCVTTNHYITNIVAEQAPEPGKPEPAAAPTAPAFPAPAAPAAANPTPAAGNPTPSAAAPTPPTAAPSAVPGAPSAPATAAPIAPPAVPPIVPPAPTGAAAPAPAAPAH